MNVDDKWIDEERDSHPVKCASCSHDIFVPMKEVDLETMEERLFIGCAICAEPLP